MCVVSVQCSPVLSPQPNLSVCPEANIAPLFCRHCCHNALYVGLTVYTIHYTVNSLPCTVSSVHSLFHKYRTTGWHKLRYRATIGRRPNSRWEAQRLTRYSEFGFMRLALQALDTNSINNRLKISNAIWSVSKTWLAQNTRVWHSCRQILTTVCGVEIS